MKFTMKHLQMDIYHLPDLLCLRCSYILRQIRFWQTIQIFMAVAEEAAAGYQLFQDALIHFFICPFGRFALLYKQMIKDIIPASLKEWYCSFIKAYPLRLYVTETSV